MLKYSKFLIIILVLISVASCIPSSSMTYNEWARQKKEQEIKKQFSADMTFEEWYEIKYGNATSGVEKEVVEKAIATIIAASIACIIGVIIAQKKKNPKLRQLVISSCIIYLSFGLFGSAGLILAAIIIGVYLLIEKELRDDKNKQAEETAPQEKEVQKDKNDIYGSEFVVQKPTEGTYNSTPKKPIIENKLYELELKLENVRQKLDKEKNKRMLIMFIFYFAISALVGLSITKFDYSNIVNILAISAVASAVLVFIPLFVFSVVTSLFTKIYIYEDVENDLIHRIDNLKISELKYYDEFSVGEHKIRLKKENLETENKLYRFETKLETVRQKIDKEKNKRIMIMLAVYFAVSTIIGIKMPEFEYQNIGNVLAISAVISAVLLFVPLFAHSFVTTTFTNIHYLEDTAKDLIQKIHNLKVSEGEYYDELYEDDYNHELKMNYFIAGITPPNDKE